MKQLVFVTNNQNKLTELSLAVKENFKILSLKDINCFDEIPETSPTIEGNAFLKSKHIHDIYHIDCFADDTGLEIEALNGEPGVYSARYAGENSSSEDNLNMVLEKLKGIENRKARFKTVISLIINNKEIQFEGIAEGHILKEKSGQSGFGYDPIFLPIGHDKTFAEMTLEEKNLISHRGLAVKKLIKYLRSYEY